MSLRLSTLAILAALIVSAVACGDDGATPLVDAGSDSGGADIPTQDTGGEDTSRMDVVEPDSGVEGYNEPTGASGTRLRRIYMEGDGSYLTVGLWDTELDASCAFQEAADGSLRCRPDQTEQLYFSDTGCTQAFIENDPENCSPGFARNRNAIFRRTETPAVLSGRVFYQGSAGECQESGVGVTNPLVAEEVPSAMFVRGTVNDQARTGEMVARYIDGEDGSRVLQEVLHQTLGYRCDFRGRVEGACLPARVPGFGTSFLDAGCTQPLLGENSEPNSVIAARGRRTCGVELEYYAVGAEISPTNVYSNATGTCVLVPPPSRTRYYSRIGARVPVESFPSALRSLEGDGTLQTVRYTDVDGMPLESPSAFWNPAVDRECDPTKHRDGTYRCLPHFTPWTSFYWNDAACETTRVVETAQCEPPPMYVISSQGSCESGIQGIETLFERGPALASGMVYRDSGSGSGSCRSRDLSSLLPRLFSVGPELESTALPELERMME